MGCIDVIMGGLVVALALSWLLEAPVLVAAVTGSLVGGLEALSFAYQVQRFRLAATVVPQPLRKPEPRQAGGEGGVSRVL